VAVVGANGAGKTTLFNVMLGLCAPDTGGCSILGAPSANLPPSIRGRLSFVADHAGPIPWASACDIARLYRILYPRWNQETFDRLLSSWHIDAFRRLNQLSKGQKRLAELALAAAIEPGILMLDEPFNGLDAVMRIHVQNLLRSMQRESGATILYATHILTELPAVADRMIVVRKGTVVYDAALGSDGKQPHEIFSELYHEDIHGEKP
jgi:ABC-2 type transport system ATP-binding protein